MRVFLNSSEHKTGGCKQFNHIGKWVIKGVALLSSRQCYGWYSDRVFLSIVFVAGK
jgi:hypothetical protein